jgi:hypothetical protein
MWEQASHEQQTHVKDTLAGLMGDTKSNEAMRSQVACCVGALASHTVPNDEWPEVFPALGEVFTLGVEGGDKVSVQGVLTVLDRIAELAADRLTENGMLETVLSMFNAGLEHADAGVRKTAMRATITLLITLEEDRQVVLAPLINPMFSNIVTAYEQRDSESVTDFLEELIDIAQMSCAFVADHIGMVIQLARDISNCTELEDFARRRGLEFFISLAEGGRGLVRTQPNYHEYVFSTVFGFLLDFPEHAVELWMEEKEEEDDYENHAVGRDALDRLSQSLGESAFSTFLHPLIHSALSKPQPAPQHYATLIGLTKLLKYTCNITEPDVLTEMVLLLVQTFAAEAVHPLVLQAAVTCLAELAVNLQGAFQELFHAQFFECMKNAVGDHAHPRVLRHCLLTMIDFLNHANSEVISGYVDWIYPVCEHVLSDGKQDLKARGACFTVMASVCKSLEQPPHPGLFKFIMQTISQQPLPEEDFELVAKAIECLGFYSIRVGREEFSKDFPTVMEVLLRLQDLLTTQYAKQEPFHSELVSIFPTLLECVGAELFQPFLDTVLQPVFASACIQDEVHIRNEGEEKSELEGVSGYESFTYNMRLLGKKRVTLNNAMVDEKCKAVEVIYEYCALIDGERSDIFLPYVHDVYTLMIGLFEYSFKEDVKKHAMNTVPYVMSMLKRHHAATEAGDSKQEVKHMFDCAIGLYLQNIHRSLNLESVNLALESCANMWEHINFAPDPAQFSAANKVIQHLLSQHEERRQLRLEMEADATRCDEEELSLMQEETEVEDDGLLSVYSLIGKMMSSAGASYVNTFANELLVPISAFLDTDTRTLGSVNFGCCCLADMLEHGDPAVVGKQAPRFFEFVIMFATGEEASLRHSCCFAIGSISKVLGVQMDPVNVKRAVDALVTVLSGEDARASPELAAATDGAVSALCKVCRYALLHNPQAELQQLCDVLLVQFLLPNLPLQDDLEENKSVAFDVLYFLEQKNVSPSISANVPVAVSSFFAHILVDPACVTPELAQHISTFYLSLKEQMDESQLLQYVQGLVCSEEAQQNVATILGF